jgi:hypothetical protein
MTQNTISLWAEIVGVAGGALVLLLFGLALAIPHHPKVGSGSSGHRQKAEESINEEIRPDGYIDSFAREIEEAGGELPTVVRLALPGILLWWLLYLILNWIPR